MNKIILGKTNLIVSEVGAGCWAIGGPFTNLGVDGGWSNVPEKDAKIALMKSIELGTNLFDTADVYGLGKSERLLGWAIRESISLGKHREDFVIASKTGLFKGCAVHGYEPLQMKHQLEMTLSNLGVDYIDIYFLHHLDFGKNNAYLDGAIETVRQFKEKGLIRFIGLRGPHHFSFYRNSSNVFNADINTFKKLAELVDPAVITIRYNMFSETYNKPDTDIFEWARQRDIGILIYKSLAQGLLIGAFSSSDPPTFEIGDSRRRKLWFKAPVLQAIEGRLNLIKKHFNVKTTRELVQLCIQYCLTRYDKSSVLIGFENETHVTDAFQPQERLSDDDVKFIRKVFSNFDEEVNGYADLYFETNLKIES